MPTRAEIVAEARSWVGTAYRHQASLKGVGADCLGLVRGVWRAVVGPEPEALSPYTRDWAEASRRESLIEAGRRHLVEVPVGCARPGDVVLFRFRPHLPAKHAGILAAEGRFIHAYDAAGVVESALVPWWARRIACAFAFPDVSDPE
jgi:NlpC/P60 family putative phage cell wall peptidase